MMIKRDKVKWYLKFDDKKLFAGIKRIFFSYPRKISPLFISNYEISSSVLLSQQNFVPMLRSGVNNRSILDNGLEGGVQAYPILRQQIWERGFAEIIERSGKIKRHERPNGDRPMGSLFGIVAGICRQALY